MDDFIQIVHTRFDRIVKADDFSFIVRLIREFWIIL